MSLVASGGFGNSFPGATALIASAEATVGWGGSFWGGYQWVFGGIDSAAVDAGASPNTILRPGLLLGKNTSTGRYLQYSPNAADGTEIAAAILTVEVNMLDPYTNAVASRWMGYLIAGGPVKAATINGLDGQARAQMRGRFMFDDDFMGRLMPWLFVQPKTSGTSYQVTTADAGSLLIANSSGTFTFTLPAIANGLTFAFLNEANQTMVINSTEGSNIIYDNTATASTLEVRTASHKIGGYCEVTSMYDGTALKWVTKNYSYLSVISAS